MGYLGGYLIDTHCFLWAIKEPARLSKRVSTLLAARGVQIFISVASLWEIAIKARLGKLDAPSDPQFFASHVDEMLLRPLAVELGHVNGIFDLPDHHKDPFDRLLIAQAMAEDLTIITVDPAFRRYDVKVIW